MIGTCVRRSSHERDGGWRQRPGSESLAASPPPEHLIPISTSPRRAALVCTMAYNSASLDSFICYYLYLGFSTLYLYLDDPSDASVSVARRYPPDRVRVRLRDAQLQDEWRAVPSWSRLQLYAQREVQARQMLNCEHAIAQCRANGEQWLLHVDSDEMLYLPAALDDAPSAPSARSVPSVPSVPSERPGHALQAHLAELDRLGAILFTYRNLEAVPEALECADPYTGVSLFKQHPSRLDERVCELPRSPSSMTIDDLAFTSLINPLTPAPPRFLTRSPTRMPHATGRRRTATAPSTRQSVTGRTQRTRAASSSASTTTASRSFACATPSARRGACTSGTCPRASAPPPPHSPTTHS